MKKEQYNPLVIMWFRQDLRLQDNPALTEAASLGRVLPIYIFDEVNSKDKPIGAASRVWLKQALLDLNHALDHQLNIYHGKADDIIRSLVKRLNPQGVFWNRCYEPWRITRDEKIKAFLHEHSILAKSFNGSLLWEPWTIHKSDQTPYRVFTPYYRKGCMQAPEPRYPCPMPNLDIARKDVESLDVNCVFPETLAKWPKAIRATWDISEKGAHHQLSDFIETGLSSYKEGRNIPSHKSISKLSPYLHFGQNSPHTVWHTVQSLDHNEHVDHFCSELGWREFSYSQLYYNPTLASENINAKFDTFPWVQDPQALKLWQTGQTGIPMVDAGMRQLYQEGYMHNRVRMIVASFLVKNLMIDWRCGEQWFWDCLFDADWASNCASWQWVAGCGLDAAPYFRIFNPITQGLKFDPQGLYVKQYVPELLHMPLKYIHQPWEAPLSILQQANVQLGVTYPRPMVDLKSSRALALEAYSSLKGTI